MSRMGGSWMGAELEWRGAGGILIGKGLKGRGAGGKGSWRMGEKSCIRELAGS